MNPFSPALDEPARTALKATVAGVGFAAFGPEALSESMFAALRDEAEGQRGSAWGRAEGQTVDHRHRRANLGPAAKSFLTAPGTLALLAEVAGGRLIPSFEASCFTYYDGPNDFLAPHLDRPSACAFTLIVYLSVNWPDGAAPGPGLELQVFAFNAALDRDSA